MLLRFEMGVEGTFSLERFVLAHFANEHILEDLFNLTGHLCLLLKLAIVLCHFVTMAL